MEKSKPKSQNANNIHAHETVQTLSGAILTLPPYISILWIWQKFWQVLERIKTFQLLAIQLSHLVQQSFNYSSALLLQLPWSALSQLLPFWFSRTAVACHFVFINVQKLNTLYLFRTLNSSHLSRMLFKILLFLVILFPMHRVETVSKSTFCFSHGNEKQKLLLENMLWCRGPLHFLGIIEQTGKRCVRLWKWSSLTSTMSSGKTISPFVKRFTAHQIKSHSYTVFFNWSFMNLPLTHYHFKLKLKVSRKKHAKTLFKKRLFSSVTNTNREETNQTNFKQN